MSPDFAGNEWEGRDSNGESAGITNEMRWRGSRAESGGVTDGGNAIVSLFKLKRLLSSPPHVGEKILLEQADTSFELDEELI